MRLWLKADALTLNNNDLVASWTDSSSNANHATQSTSTRQPTYKTSILNGKPVVSFDGGDFVATGSTLSLTTFSISVVFRASAHSIVYEHGNGSSVYLYTTTNNTIQATKGSVTSGRNLSTSWGIGSTWRIVTVTFDGTQAGHLMYINAASQTLINVVTGDPGTASNAQTMYIGARGAVPNLYTTGDIAEFVCYSAVLTSTERANLESYLNAKYAVY